MKYIIMAALTAMTLQVAGAQEYRYNPEHRRPIEATMQDLHQVAERHHYEGRDRERIENAERHLHQFAERLHEGGGFDKDKLDQAIEDVQNVVDNNRMGPEGHERLQRDANELRRLRQRYDDRNYRYGR